MSYSILIVDDNAAVRYYLRRYIEQNEAWKVCGEAENGQIAVDRVRQLNPDVVILDLQMPVMGGLEAARQIGLVSPNTTIILFTMHNVALVEGDALAAGIEHVVSKEDGTGHLLSILKGMSLK